MGGRQPASPRVELRTVEGPDPPVRNGRYEEVGVKRLVYAFGSLAIAMSLYLVGSYIAVAPAEASTPDSAKEALGKAIFFDTRLSTPDGLACAGCHTPTGGWADPDQTLPVSGGIIDGDYGSRNAPSAAYAATSPTFFFNDACGCYVGGQFWDGRAATLADQAKGPFLNPIEMHNPDQAAVVTAR